MNAKHFSLVLLSTNQCNAACDYCFEDRTSERLSLERLQLIVDKVLDHMDDNRIGALTIHWQGGEAMLLPPQWYRQAFALIRDAADARGKRVEHDHSEDVRIGPFDELLNYFTHRDALLPCIRGQNCADQLIAIDARGHVAQCDCWVTSYPDYRFGNILECDSLSELINGSGARQRFFERPVKLMQGDCIQCDYLTLCHGGCPVRTYSVHRTLFEKDPYCHLYKTLFRHLENRAAQRLVDIR